MLFFSCRVSIISSVARRFRLNIPTPPLNIPTFDPHRHFFKNPHIFGKKSPFIWHTISKKDPHNFFVAFLCDIFKKKITFSEFFLHFFLKIKENLIFANYDDFMFKMSHQTNFISFLCDNFPQNLVFCPKKFIPTWCPISPHFLGESPLEKFNPHETSNIPTLGKNPHFWPHCLW